MPVNCQLKSDKSKKNFATYLLPSFLLSIGNASGRTMWWKKEGPAIGIYLGTTYSCVGVWKNNRAEIIINDQGNTTTPSCVAYTESECLVGEAAGNQAAMNPSNTVYGVKRFIGRRFDDESVQSDMKLCSYKIVPGKDRKPLIVVKQKGKEKQVTPEEISSMILQKMRSVAEQYLRQPITDAVITVPAFFNDSQRSSTKIAGKLAGFNVLAIINEPNAAAIAYGLMTFDGYGRSKTVLVFDLGDGTLDVSLLRISQGEMPKVIVTVVFTRVGGDDFDTNMVRYFVDFIKRTTKMDLTGNAKALRLLRTACERAKRVLSSANDTVISIDSLYDGIDFSSKISRAKFEKINGDLFNRCMEPVKNCLAKASMEKSQVDDVVLVGGSTWIPRIQVMLMELFDGAKLCASMDPETVVAHGAAILAAKMSGPDLVLDDVVPPSILVETSGEVTTVVTPRNNLIQNLPAGGKNLIQNPVLDDVAPISIGVETSGEVMTVVIPKNTPVPVRKEHTVTTYYDNQRSVVIRVFEGEGSLTDVNYFLGELELTGIPEAPSGVPDIIVCFEIHVDGTLTVSAEERKCGRTESMTITDNVRRFRWMVLRR